MAWGQGTTAADADAYGGNQGIDAAEAAGGPENEATEMDIASALADALAGANVDDFGAYAAQDQQSQDQLSQGEQERMAQAAAQAAYDDVIGSSTGIAQANIAALGGFQDQSGPPGYESPGVGTGVEDFSSGGYATAPATSDLSFSAYGQQTQPGMSSQEVLGSGFAPSQDFLSPGEQERVDAAGQFDFASPTAAGTPGYAQPGSAWGQGQVEDFTGIPGVGTMATEEGDTPLGTAGQGGVSMSTPFNLAGGLINQGGSAPFSETTGGQGAIIAGSQEMDEGTLDPNAGGVSAPAASPAGTDFFGGDGNVGVATDSPAGTRMTAEDVNVYGKEQVDKSIMSMSEQLMAKAKADPNGIAIKGTNITNQRMANAFNSLDQYSKAYAATQGGSFLGGLISGAMPFGAAVKGIQGWLTKNGMYSKQMGQDLLAVMQSAVDTGDLSQIVRELGGGGPSDEDVEGPKEVRSFIEQYPWAAELDPKYIKYLIDNPAALQDLLGQGPGGGDQETQGV